MRESHKITYSTILEEYLEEVDQHDDLSAILYKEMKADKRAADIEAVLMAILHDLMKNKE